MEAFFDLNTQRRTDPTDKFDLFYTHISKYYVFSSGERKWKQRKQLEFQHSNIGYRLNRLDNISVKQGELFYLRLLLLHVPNPTSYDYLKTVHGTLYPTFQQACVQRDLLQDDNVWDSTLSEAISIHHPKVVRSIFAQILSYGEISDPLALWQKYKTSLAEDFRRVSDSPSVTDHMLDCTILDLEEQLNHLNFSLNRVLPLKFLLENARKNSIIPPKSSSHLLCQSYSPEECEVLSHQYNSTYSSANIEQKQVLDYIVQCVTDSSSTTGTSEYNHNIMLLASAGTGKTYVLKMV